MRERAGYVYVALQFVCVGIIVLGGPVIPASGEARVVLLAALALGLWAIVSIGPGRFRISPYLHPSGRLQRRGPYRAVRHPMYLALILAMLALVLDDPAPVRLLAWGGLVVVLILKLRMEEVFLREQHPGYARYAESTRRLIPFVY